MIINATVAYNGCCKVLHYWTFCTHEPPYLRFLFANPWSYKWFSLKLSQNSEQLHQKFLKTNGDSITIFIFLIPSQPRTRLSILTSIVILITVSWYVERYCLMFWMAEIRNNWCVSLAHRMSYVPCTLAIMCLLYVGCYMPRHTWWMCLLPVIMCAMHCLLVYLYEWSIIPFF